MEHTEHTITVAAPEHVVWEVLADIEGYQDLFPPTQASTIIEEGEGYQIAELVVDVSGQVQSWVTHRELDRELGVISYRQLKTAPLVAHMGGEWRMFRFGPDHTQLVLTHDFAAKQVGEDGTVAHRFTHQEAHDLLCAAVERNSVADLAAVRDESVRRAASIRRTEKCPA